MDSNRKQPGKPAEEPIGPKAEKTLGHHVRDLVSLTKMCRGYSVTVRGELPDDIIERICRLHSAALRAGM